MKLTDIYENDIAWKGINFKLVADEMVNTQVSRVLNISQEIHPNDPAQRYEYVLDYLLEVIRYPMMAIWILAKQHGLVDAGESVDSYHSNMISKIEPFFLERLKEARNDLKKKYRRRTLALRRSE